jgi:putative transposase
VQTVIKSMIIRLFPTKEQEQMMWNHVHAARFIWNYMLGKTIEFKENHEKIPTAFDMNKALTPMKKEEQYLWLNQVSNAMLCRTNAHLGFAIQRWRNGTGFPKFKSRKKAKPSFAIRDSVGSVWFSETYVTLPTVKKVAYKTNYNIPLGNKVKFINPTISYTPNGKWILTLGVECENQAPTLTDKPMGIDLGIKELAVVAFGDEQIVFHNKNKSKEVREKRRRLKHLQRNLSRKYKQNGSYEETENIKKLKEKIKRLYYHISNIQHDYIHQTTHKLISLLPCKVTMENLNVKCMMKNRHLSRAVQEQCFYEFRRQMEYKCAWNGIEFVLADKWYPSSKICSCCGAYKKDLKLKDRTYVCSKCGMKIDRDYNAAINLMRYKAQSST